LLNTSDRSKSILALNAELAAFPLSTYQFFTSSQNLLIGEDGYSVALRQVEDRLLPSCNLSIEEFRLRAKKIFFGNNDDRLDPKLGDLSIHRFLKSMTLEYLSPRGAFASVVDDRFCQGPDRRATTYREQWRWISRFLPADLLLTSTWCSAHQPTDVEVSPPQLRQRMLDSGYTETHLHMGAGFDFSVYWTAMIGGLIDKDTLAEYTVTGSVFPNSREFVKWLLLSAVIRFMAADYLFAVKTKAGMSLNFNLFIRRRSCDFSECLGLSANRFFASVVRSMSRGVFDLDVPPDDVLRQILQTFYLSDPTFGNSRALASGKEDPLSRFYPDLQVTGCQVESFFYQSAFSYMGGMGSKDFSFARLFWQYIRIRCMHFRDVVMSTATPGLSEFSRKFSNLSFGKRGFSTASLAMNCAITSGKGKGLRNLELRTSPGTHSYDIGTLILDIDKTIRPALKMTNNQEDILEWGLILHFQRRDSDRKVTEKADWKNLNSFANPKHKANMQGFRFEGFYRSVCRQAVAIHNLMIKHPSILTRLRGIDLCSDENAIPYWVFCGIFQKLRSTSDTATKNFLNRYKRQIQPLRCTIHVGEHFLHLQSGLRSIGTVLDYMPLRSGDRLGHAMALGLDVSRWSRRHGTVAMFAEDRLFDLVWEWDCYSRGVSCHSNSRIMFLEKEIGRLSRNIFDDEFCLAKKSGPIGQFVTVPNAGSLSELVQTLHDPDSLRAYGFPDSQSRINDLVSVFLTSKSVFLRGRDVIEVDTSNDIEPCEGIQLWLRKRVAEKGLAVEINPSSNLMIGQLGDLLNHPMWRIKNPASIKAEPTIPIIIGSDDPVTFSTRLPDEYAMLFDAMVDAGLSSDDAFAWLDTARQYGNDYRFTTSDAFNVKNSYEA
jgi:hypothetical protein